MSFYVYSMTTVQSIIDCTCPVHTILLCRVAGVLIVDIPQSSKLQGGKQVCFTGRRIGCLLCEPALLDLLCRDDAELDAQTKAIDAQMLDKDRQLVL